MISHGFVSAAMFLCIGVLYDRMHSRLISDYGGVINVMPKFAAFSLFFCTAIGLPGAPAASLGSLCIALGAVQHNFWVGFAAATLILGAAYSLWMYKRVMFVPITKPYVSDLMDLDAREFFILTVLAIAALAMGL